MANPDKLFYGTLDECMEVLQTININGKLSEVKMMQLCGQLSEISDLEPISADDVMEPEAYMSRRTNQIKNKRKQQRKVNT